MEDNNSSQMAASSASLSTLPEELILHIFSFLSAEDLIFGVGATCQHFYNLSRSPGLWKWVTVKRRVHDGEMPCSREEILYRRMLQQECVKSNGHDTLPVRTVIRSVEEKGAVWPSCSVTGAMHYPNMESLILDRRDLPSVEFLVNHQKLRHLKLFVSPFSDNDKSQNSSGQLVIDLFENLKGLTNLQTLALHFDCWKSDREISISSSISAIQASMEDYFLTGPRLRQIELESFVNDKIFKAIFDNCLQLEGLAMMVPDFSPGAFCAAVSGKRQLLLSTLRIEACLTLNDACLKALSDAFPNIKSLGFSLTKKITNDGFRRFLEACSQLTDLKVATLYGHKMLGGKTSKTLQSLRLSKITFSSALAFEKLCQYSQNLHDIYLLSADINNTNVTTLANSCRLLEKVTLRDCSQVDSTGVAYLMKNLPHLQNLRCELSEPHYFPLEQLFSSRNRTRAGGLVLENQAGPTENRLRSLALERCQELTPIGVLALAKLCGNLRVLEIHTTNCVNDCTVGRILRNLPNLQSLTLETISESSRQNQLTGACLRGVQRWGTRLQNLKLITRYRSFTIAALLNLLAHSSTLVQCTVPYHTEQSPVMSVKELHRLMREQESQLQGQVQIGFLRVLRTETVSVEVLEVSILRR